MTEHPHVAMCTSQYRLKVCGREVPYSDWLYKPFLSLSSSPTQESRLDRFHTEGKWELRHVDWEMRTTSWCPFCCSLPGDRALKHILPLACYGERSRQRNLKRVPNKLLTTSTRLEPLHCSLWSSLDRLAPRKTHIWDSNWLILLRPVPAKLWRAATFVPCMAWAVGTYGLGEATSHFGGCA